MLGEESVDMFDGYISDSFNLHVRFLCTINDFPTCGNLSGYSTKGHKACPIHEEDTCHHQLQNGRKTIDRENFNLFISLFFMMNNKMC